MPKSDSEVYDVERWNTTYVKIIGALATVILIVATGVVTWYVNMISDRHEAFQRQINEMRDLLSARGERITRLESRVEECERRKP